MIQSVIILALDQEEPQEERGAAFLLPHNKRHSKSRRRRRRLSTLGLDIAPLDLASFEIAAGANHSHPRSKKERVAQDVAVAHHSRFSSHSRRSSRSGHRSRSRSRSRCTFDFAPAIHQKNNVIRWTCFESARARIVPRSHT